MRKAWLRILGGFGVVCAVFLGLSGAAFADTIDPVGFCSTTTTPTTANGLCSTGTGLSGETIAIGATGFYMFKNGSGGTAFDPWNLLVAIPNYSGAAPTITGPFTQNSVTDKGIFLSTTSGDLYAFAGLSGDSSMNAANMFGANEVAAFGSTPSFFRVFAYNYTPAIADETAYLFSVSGSGLSAGTFLAGAGGDNPFTTPFTVTGLVKTSTSVPEPSSLVLLSTCLLGFAAWARKKVKA